MKKTFVKTGISMMIAAALLASCKKSGPTYITASSSQLSMGIKADNAITPLNATGATALSSTPQPSATVTFTSAIANISGFKFEAKKKGVQIEVESKNLSTIDLFAINPTLIGITLDTGTYSEIELRVEFAKSSTATLPLVVKGTFTTTGGTVVPVEFDLNDNAEIKVEQQNVVVDGKTNLTNVVVLHLNKLLTGVSSADLNAATLTNGTIIISSSSNSSIYNRILNNLSSCGDSNGFEHHNK